MKTMWVKIFIFTTPCVSSLLTLQFHAETESHRRTVFILRPLHRMKKVYFKKNRRMKVITTLKEIKVKIQTHLASYAKTR